MLLAQNILILTFVIQDMISTKKYLFSRILI